MTHADQTDMPEVRKDFETWLTKTIDCKFGYDPVAGYVPQEVYQLYQAWNTAWNTRRIDPDTVAVKREDFYRFLDALTNPVFPAADRIANALSLIEAALKEHT